MTKRTYPYSIKSLPIRIIIKHFCVVYVYLLYKGVKEGALTKFRNDGSNVVLALKRSANIRLNKTV
ncbi:MULTISPECIES: hypothetical protein [Bacillus]|uniref:hypothetical protein n=1 Tax=Bacillus TaxID=1386 RepID=UPI00032EEE74|nr:hypothetical protein [Bacillus mycoides]EOO40905.1 hypothetical protein IKK_01106 [Bacillus mycoides]QWH97675.1 hypothetical protein EXW36_06495 [Bacillus mycoides]